MNVWIFVEGQSDELALRALFQHWIVNLGNRGSSIRFIRLGGKNEFLKRIGDRGAEKLAGDRSDFVVTLPDLYPITGFTNHRDFDSLCRFQTDQIRESLLATQRVRKDELESFLGRLRSSAFKYELEMLLLAASDALRAVLQTSQGLGQSFITPVEEQNLGSPPKKIVRDLFRLKSRRRREYRETTDAKDVLERVSDNIGSILRTPSGQPQCPCFQSVLDWLGQKTGVLLY